MSSFEIATTGTLYFLTSGSTNSMRSSSPVTEFNNGRPSQACKPFSNAPVSKRFYFDNAVHSRAMIRMKYTAESNKGLALLIGDIGTGKTTLARKMLEEFRLP